MASFTWFDLLQHLAGLSGSQSLALLETRGKPVAWHWSFLLLDLTHLFWVLGFGDSVLNFVLWLSWYEAVGVVDVSVSLKQNRVI